MNNLDTNLINQIKNLLIEARTKVLQTVNTTMVHTYYNIGKLIIENEQNGKEKAEYGKEILKNLSKELTAEFGKGFSKDNLENMRKFYLVYEKTETVSRKFNLSWSHYVFLMRRDEIERKFYEKESEINNWSLRELKRQFNSALFERIALSKDKKGVLEDNIEKYHLPENPQDIIKDPYILEFLGLEENSKYSESELEQKLIDKIETFILELGKGFLFSGRQVRFTYDEEHFIVDLVFYNRILKCFVIIDLKIGKLKHQDIGQMQMYVNYYDRNVKLDDENKTIGIIICKDKNDSVVEMTLPENNTQIFASKYQMVMPSKEELIGVLG